MLSFRSTGRSNAAPKVPRRRPGGYRCDGQWCRWTTARPDVGAMTTDGAALDPAGTGGSRSESRRFPGWNGPPLRCPSRRASGSTVARPASTTSSSCVDAITVPSTKAGFEVESMPRRPDDVPAPERAVLEAAPTLPITSGRLDAFLTAEDIPVLDGTRLDVALAIDVSYGRHATASEAADRVLDRRQSAQLGAAVRNERHRGGRAS